MGFQKSVNQYLPPACEGDFASSNPRASVLASENQLTAGAAGVTVGRFAWASAAGVVLNSGSGAPSGFVHREQQGLITTWLAEQTMLVPQGLPVVLHNEGDFWVKNTVTVATLANPRLKAFASLTDGTVQFAAAGATVAGYIETNYVLGGFSNGGTGATGELVKITTGGKQ